MFERSCLVGLAAALCLSIGCVAPEEPDTGEARQAQMDNGTHVWKKHYLYFEECGYNCAFAELLVIGDSQVGVYRANTEYWFVHDDHIGRLGVQDLAIETTWGSSNPPSPSGDQEFTQPVAATWSRFLSDPVSGGYLYDSDNQHLRIGITSGQVSRLTWYQTIPQNETPENLVLGSSAEVGSGSVGIPSGEYGYYADAMIP
jgi:hypothetical protein